MATELPFEEQMAAGTRFGFGGNWRKFLELLNDDRIAQAERSLVDLLGVANLEGRSFLDIGSGSGLFSLAARRLGASVVSMDFDPDSVRCTEELRRRFFPGDGSWKIIRGSVLDDGLMTSLSQFDVVYSWGVLHHTGNLHQAIANAVARVRPGGLLCLALYRKTILCPFWKVEKRLYCASPEPVRALLRKAYGTTVGVAYRLAHPGVQVPRGMDENVDVADWLGGYPYESITPRELKAILTRSGFAIRLQHTKSEGLHITPGCDEFVFEAPATTPLTTPWA